MIQAVPMVVLADVEAGSLWFQRVLGLVSGHGGADYEMLMDDDRLVAQLHRWDADEHPHLGREDNPSRGNGILLWFAVDDFDAAMLRIGAHQAVIVEGPLTNPLAHHREVWLRGPEGCTVVLSGE